MPNSETLHLSRSGGSIGYDVTGDGPLVVCVPGMGDLRQTYRFLAPALTVAGFRVATMDLRGHGDSSIGFASYDDEAAATDVTALVEHLGGPALLVGNSMGAGAAALAAATRPELVSGLVLLGAFVRDAQVPRLLALAFRGAMAGPWAPRVWCSYLSRLYPTRPPADFAAYRKAILAGLRRPGYTAAFRATTRTSHAVVERRLGDVRAPALVVMGSADPDFADPAAEGRWIADQLSGSLLVVDGAGHYAHAEFPDVVNPAVLDFARSVGSSA